VALAVLHHLVLTPQLVAVVVVLMHNGLALVALVVEVTVQVALVVQETLEDIHQ
jgi:hypothetical protein